MLPPGSLPFISNRLFCVICMKGGVSLRIAVGHKSVKFYRGGAACVFSLSEEKKERSRTCVLLDLRPRLVSRLLSCICMEWFGPVNSTAHVCVPLSEGWFKIAATNDSCARQQARPGGGDCCFGDGSYWVLGQPPTPPPLTLCQWYFLSLHYCHASLV